MGEKSKKILLTILILVVLGVLLFFFVFKKDKTYTVSFKSGDGTTITKKVGKDGKLEKPEDPKKEGYIFEGWFLDDKVFNFDQEITEDMTLEARWKEDEESKTDDLLTVYFNTSGGSMVSSQKIEKGEKVSKPSEPYKNGYIFTGWYLEDELYDFTDEVNSNITLVARWTLNKLPVKSTMSLISTLPTDVTLEDKAAIEKARSSYNSLVQEQQGLVSNLQKLIDAEKQLNALLMKLNLAKSTAKVDLSNELGKYSQSDYSPTNWTALNNAKKAGDKAIDSATSLDGVQTAKNNAINNMALVKTLAEETTDLIAGLPSEITLADKTAVEKARAAYDALTDTQKAEVTNLATLTNAEAKIKALELQNAKDAAKTELNEKLATFNEVDYSSKNWTELNNAKTVGDKAIDSATSTEDVTTQKTNAITAMDDVKTLVEETIDLINALPAVEALSLTDKAQVKATRTAFDALTDTQKALVTNLETLTNAEAEIARLEAELQNAKDAAKTELNEKLATFNEVDYSSKNWTELNNAKTVGDKAIDSATSTEDVTTQKTNAITAMDDVKTLVEETIDLINALPAVEALSLTDKAQVKATRTAFDALTDTQKALVTNLETLKNAEAEIARLEAELQNAKDAAKTELNEKLATFNEADYSSENWTALNSAKTTGDTNIDGATTIEEVEPAKTSAITAMDDVKTLVEETIDLINALPAVEDLSLTDKAQVEKARTAFDALTDTQKALVTNLETLKNAEAEIARLEAELQNAKDAAKVDLSNELGKYSQSDYSPLVWAAINNAKTTGDANIDAATSLTEIETAKTDAITEMKKKTTALLINSTTYASYTTLSAALNGAVNGEKVVLQKDALDLSAAGGSTITEKSVTLDLNGKKITAKSRAGLNQLFLINADASLTITDNSADGLGSITGNGNSNLFVNYGRLVIDSGVFSGVEPKYAIYMEGTNSETIINGGTFYLPIGSNGSKSGGKLTIHNGTFNRVLYLASADTVTNINGGTFTTISDSVIEVKAGELNITGGTFTNNIDTSTNSVNTAINESGSGDYKGVIVLVKSKGSKPGSYGSPIKFNATGGTITNTSGDAIVYSDQRTDATNGLGITYYVNGATVNGTIGNYTTNSVLM